MGTLTLSGTTEKTDDEIAAFNERWHKRFPKYNILGANCQIYAKEFIEFLVGGSFEPPCTLPQAGLSVWHTCQGSHQVQRDGLYCSKQTQGKVGAILMLFGIEAEGPKIHIGYSKKKYFGNWGGFIEASLFRVEIKLCPLRVRLEVNIDTAFGLRDGQFQVKVLGFGISCGMGGMGLATPVAGLGLGKF